MRPPSTLYFSTAVLMFRLLLLFFIHTYFRSLILVCQSRWRPSRGDWRQYDIMILSWCRKQTSNSIVQYRYFIYDGEVKIAGIIRAYEA